MQKHVLFTSSMLLMLSLAFGPSVLFTAYSEESPVPSWIRTTAGWWSTSQISNEEFTK